MAVANGPIQSMCIHSCKKYPRHRWTGFDSSIPSVGTLEVAHQISSKATFEHSAIFDRAGARRS